MNMSCDCGFSWESDHPKDSVDYHMMYHKGEKRLQAVEKSDSEWHLCLVPVAYKFGFTLDD